MKKVLIGLDLDGTIRRCKSDPNGFINEPFDQEPILEALMKVAGDYNKDNYEIVAFSNQKGVMDGYKTEDDLREEIQYTMRVFSKISHVFVCPNEGNSMYHFHFKGNTFYSDLIQLAGFNVYRKPDPGMYYFGMQRAFGTDYKDLFERQYYSGDRQEDKEFAFRSGMTYLTPEEFYTVSL